MFGFRFLEIILHIWRSTVSLYEPDIPSSELLITGTTNCEFYDYFNLKSRLLMPALINFH